MTRTPVRTLILLGTSGLGGAERQAVLLARHLAGDPRMRVTVAAPGHGVVPDLCAAAGLPFLAVPAFESRRMAVCLARMLGAALRLRRARPDLLLPFTWPANILCGIFRRTTGASWALWNQRDAGIGRLVPGLERRAIAGCTGYAANSPPGVDFLTGTLGLDPQRVDLVPNVLALPPARLDRAGWRARLEIAGQRPAAVMLANLQRHKDHATLLRSWALLPPPRPLLILAGRPDDTASALRTLAAELGVADDVRWPGAVDDVAGLLSACDLGLFSSPSEGCPNGLIEAMGAGLPCVASDIPGIRFAAPHGCLLVPAGDPAAFAAAIGRLLVDLPLRETLRLQARSAAERFSPESALAAAARAVSRATHGQWQPA